MRQLPIITVVLGSTAFVLALLFVCVQPLALAQVPLPPTTAEKGKDSFLNDKMSFPESKETKRQFEAVGEYLAQKDIKWDLVCRLAQGMLDAKSDYFYQFEDGDKRRVSVKDEVNRIIGKFTPEGKGFYQNNYGPAAENLLKTAKEAGFDKTKLAEVAQRYFYTKAGTEASQLLAAINLETGNYPEAAYGYRRLLARADAETAVDAKNLFRAAVAIRRAGDGKQTDEIAGIWDKLEKKYPRAGLSFGRKGYTLDQLKAELERPVELLFGAVGSQYVAMKGGDVTRASLSEAGIPFLGSILSVPMLYRTDTPDEKAAVEKVSSWIQSAYKDSKRLKAPLIPSFFPITAPNMLIFRGYDGIYAFYTRTFTDSSGRKHNEGEQAWFSHAEYGAASIESVSGVATGDAPTADSTNQRQWLERWKNDTNNPQPGILFENPLAGTLSHDGKRVYFVDDFNVPPPVNNYNPDFGGQPPPVSRSSKSEYNRLVCVDLETGMLQWHLGSSPSGKTDEDESTMGSVQLSAGAFFLGPPVTVNNKLYVLFEKEGALKMACLDSYKELPVQADPVDGGRLRGPSLKQPEVIWVQNLGRANNGLKQDAEGRRTQGTFLAAADGVMICPTNTGAFVAVDLNARSLLWAHTYAASNKANDPNNGMGGIRRFQPGTPGSANSVSRWRASSPIIVSGRVVTTAFDSNTIECLELRTGKVLWSEPRKPEDLYVAGVANGNVLVVSRNAVRAIKLVGEKDERTGKEKASSGWEAKVKIAEPIGHGVVGRDGTLYIPVIGDVDKPEDQTPAVVALDSTNGKNRGSPTVYRRKEGLAPTADPRLSLGNLVFHDGMMFSQSASEVIAFPLNEAKQKEVAVRLSENPNDPEGLLSRGELVMEAGKLQDAVADFKKAEANKPTDAVLKKLRLKLYVAYTELIKTDFGKAEPVLEEYRTLCDFPVNKDDIDAGRQIDEQIRRRGLMYCLLAKGREDQGRLIDAFDNYRAYAELGEKGKLLPVPEDPNTLALSNVWASERIDAMMKKVKDPAIRKPLEDKVAKEFEEIRAGNDLDRLRSFVKVFGPYFKPGREAQYLFAERLNATNNDENRREAQSLLLTLVGLADGDRDAANSARAMEALARLLTGRGLTDDALGLYASLAAKYPTTVVRDKKTSADLLGELITDKRYLPSLESGKPRVMGTYKATATQTGGTTRGPSTSLVNDPEAFPFFRRYRITLEGDMNSGQPTIAVTDRVTGEEKARSGPVMPMSVYGYNYNNTDPNSGINNQPIAQVSGHLLLVQVYHQIVCYDLSKDIKKDGKLWSVNLMGANVSQPQNGSQWQYQFEADKNSELVATPYYYDNNTGQQRFEAPIRIGRTMVLQSNYATVMTKDAIVTREPRTGTILWQRPSVSPRSMIFGDSRHVFLIEPLQQGTTSKVFRAVDGVEVPNVPNFATIVSNNANRLKLVGRQVLLFESTGKDKPKSLRLYDILEGKDIWAKDFPTDSIAFETIDDTLTGILHQDGKIDVVEVLTGKVLKSLQLDAAKVKEQTRDAKNKFDIVKPLLLADADRFYVFLNRDIAKPGANVQLVESSIGSSSPIRARFTNGTAYGFDRNTGKRLWYLSDEFNNMRLCVERFDEFPCLVAFNPMYNEDPNQAVRGNINNGHKIIAVDKANGALREHKILPQQNQWFTSFVFDKNTGGYELSTGSQTLKISPVTEAKK